MSETERMYPCADCGKMRTKAEGGTTFTVCDECWDKRHPPTRETELHSAERAVIAAAKALVPRLGHIELRRRPELRQLYDEVQCLEQIEDRVLAEATDKQ